MTLAHPRPWHRDSIFFAGFSTGPRRPLSIGEQAVFRARLHLAFERRRLTRAFRDVGFALLRFLGQDGRLDPTQATLARTVRCDSKTVRSALQAMHGLGMVRWQRRMVRDKGKARQTSNAYELIPDGQPIPAEQPKLRKPRNCDGNFSRQVSYVFIKEGSKPEMLPDRGESLNALDSIAAQMEKQLAWEWANRHSKVARK